MKADSENEQEVVSRIDDNALINNFSALQTELQLGIWVGYESTFRH